MYQIQRRMFRPERGFTRRPEGPAYVVSHEQRRGAREKVSRFTIHAPRMSRFFRHVQHALLSIGLLTRPATAGAAHDVPEEVFLRSVWL